MLVNGFPSFINYLPFKLLCLRADESFQWPLINILLYCRSPNEEWGSFCVHTSMFPYCLLSFIVCCVEAVQSALSSSSGGMSLYIGIDLVCGRR